MGKIGGQALKRERGITGCKILLIGEIVIEAHEIVEKPGTHANTFAKLEERWLTDESGRGRFCIKRRDGWARLVEAGANFDEPPVHFAVECDMQPLVVWFDRAYAKDRLAHAIKERPASVEFGPKPKNVSLLSEMACAYKLITECSGSSVKLEFRGGGLPKPTPTAWLGV